MLQVCKPPGPKLGFRGSLEPNSLLEIDKVHRSFRWGWNSILDHSACGHQLCAVFLATFWHGWQMRA